MRLLLLGFGTTRDVAERYAARASVGGRSCHSEPHRGRRNEVVALGCARLDHREVGSDADLRLVGRDGPSGRAA